MASNLLFFDIETVPDDKLDISLNIPAKLGNVKDEKKVLAKQKEWIDNGQIKAHSVSPFHNKIVALEMYVQDGVNGSTFANHPDNWNEKDLLRDFSIFAINADYIICFNGLNFDLPTIMFRSSMLDVKSPPISLKWYSHKPVVDLMHIIQNWDKDMKKWKSLEWFAERFRLKTRKYGQGSDIYKWYKEGKIYKIRQHCRNDVEMTKELFYRVAEVYTPEILLS